MVLADYVIEGKTIPNPSRINSINVDSNQFVNYIRVDIEKYIRRKGKKAVKKTLTIPQWLNEEAMGLNINFSQVLQEALINKINILK